MRKANWAKLLGWGGLGVLATLVSVVGIFGWDAPEGRASNGWEAFGGATPEVSVPRVPVATTRRGDLSIRKEATGTLEPWRRLEIAAEISGRVSERDFVEGQRVEGGRVLLRLEDAERLLDLEEAEAEWLAIQARHAVDFDSNATGNADSARDVTGPPDGLGGEAEGARAEHLYREGLISRRELVETRRRARAAEVLSGKRRAEVRAATSGLAQAEQRVERARLSLERTTLQAPFAGRVADVQVEVGQQVAPGEGLLTLLQDSPLKVEVDVLEKDVVMLRVGAPARVRIPALENEILQGRVHTINPRIDPETGTARVVVEIPNPGGRLMAGLFTYVELEVGRLSDRLLIPVEALLERQGRELVFRVDGGRALWTYVVTGERSGGWVEILEGLEEGTRVAVAEHFALAHETPVEPID